MMEKKRQVILFMTDTTGADMLGCYGNPAMKTPCIDELARKGVRFEKAYTCQPVCGPARSAIFTGQYPHTNGMVTNSVALRADTKTLGMRLQQAGIACGYIGKWHLDGGDYFGNGVCPAGYDPAYWYDMRCYLQELTPQQRQFSRVSKNAIEGGVEESFTYAARCTARALRFLDEYAQKDFFLTVSYDEPHDPSLCPAPYNTMYDGYSFPDSPAYHDDLANKPVYQRLWAGKALQAPGGPGAANPGQSLFLGCNSFVDSQIGRVLQKIYRQFPDAMVIFTSDHGDMHGAHRLHGKNAAFYEEIAHIPLIIKGGAAGCTVSSPASHIDIAPTVLQYMGVELPKTLQGKSMLPVVTNPQLSGNNVVFTEFTRYEVDHDGFGGLQMMRSATDGRFKLSLHLLDSDELYDLQQDPFEVHNLIDDPACSKVRNALHDCILQMMNDTRDLYRGYQWACRPWRTELQPCWENDGCTRQKETETGEICQLDYDTGLPMQGAVRKKNLH